ncbi:MAG: NHLP bacteriocin export ABC transporter permease/ATPase subunit [Anaerolineae bacterium]|nr:NHLP bacteriocin export ABC transporter permease/ATPase subunit [Anaerolineae bacterium]
MTDELDRNINSTSDEWELFLLNLRYRQANLVTRSGNEPFLLDGADRAWVVYNGKVDVFAVQIAEGEPVGARRHLFRVDTGQLLLGVNLDRWEIGLLAVCTPDTQILELRQSQLRQSAQKDEHKPLVATMLEDWVRWLSWAVRVTVRPKEFHRIIPGEPVELAAGENARVPRRIAWVRPVAGRVRFMGRDDIPDIGSAGSDRLLPLSEFTWLHAPETARLETFDTATMLGQDIGWGHLAAFHELMLDLVARDFHRERQTTRDLIREKVASDERRVQVALAQLAGAWDEDFLPVTTGIEGADPLLAACRVVGDAMGISMQPPPDVDVLLPHQDPLSEIARTSGVRLRRVLLRDDWYHHDNGPLLAFQGEDEYPVALLPLGPTRYELYDPAQLSRVPVDDTVARELGSSAYMFYRPFPNHPLTAWDLLRFGQSGARLDLLRLLLVGVLGGLLGIAVPIVTGMIFDDLLPAGERGQLVLMGGVLAISALAAALFQMARGMALLRIEGRYDSTLQAAVWDRLLSLPTDFFRRYSAGDLTQRAMGIGSIKQTLSSSVTLALLSGLFAWFNVLVLFYYSAALALVTIGIVLVSILLTAFLGYQVIRYQRQVAHKQGAISGLIGQLVGGISKLRVAGAEGRAFALWAAEFSEQKRLAFKARAAYNYFKVFMAVYPVLAAMVMFAAVYTWADLSTGGFLAFNAAFTQFLAAGLGFSAAVIAALGIVPIYERLQPILRALPEIDTRKAPPGELSGRIEVSHVSFHYEADGPLVLDDVSFSVQSGEFVALVGASGSGKSTLLRHLLGFEQPDSGAIYYDGQALAEVDLRAVRQQIGVVLQHSQVMTGSILDNIVGASNLPVEDAWEAARQAGIEDEIKQMPMGMQTYISEGGSTFSGGQRQRLLIARALVTRPRIIFFDEATSALDDRSQGLVTESLQGIDATRIVIAHRLSTIVDADRILVMERGKIVETGTYEDLLKKGGVFASLAQRQLL